jgi:two-component system, NtrC family, response regulator HydG
MQPTRNRILYVDDDEDSRWMMKVLLEMWNYEVVVAGAADDGFHLAQSQHFDVYLLDTHLPAESGFELCKQICGAPYETDKQRGLQAGAIAYLTKPLDFDVLEITLARLINKVPEKGLGKYRKDIRVLSTQARLTMD